MDEGYDKTDLETNPCLQGQQARLACETKYGLEGTEECTPLLWGSPPAATVCSPGPVNL